MPLDAIAAASAATQRKTRVGASTAAAPDSFRDLLTQANADPAASPPATAPAAGSTPLTPGQVQILNAQIAGKANVTAGVHRGSVYSGMHSANLRPIYAAPRVFPVPARGPVNASLSSASAGALAATTKHPTGPVAGSSGLSP